MAISLFDYQKDAVDKLQNGNILVGGVGSGKSRTAIAYYFTKNGGTLDPYSPMKNPKDLYIITTARKRDTLEWEGELVPFLLSKDPKNNMLNGNKIAIDVKGVSEEFVQENIVDFNRSNYNIQEPKKNIPANFANPNNQIQDYDYKVNNAIISVNNKNLLENVRTILSRFHLTYF